MAAVFQKGIDVSQFQGEIDWAAVAAGGVQFAIVRAASSDSAGVFTDTSFARNVQQAHAAGLRVGAYFYTYAQTKVYADKELGNLLGLLQGVPLEYPVFVDMEDKTIAALGSAHATELALHILGKLTANGYLAGLYTADTFARTCLRMAALSMYPFWLAEYAPTPTYTDKHAMWQYTDMGAVNGVEDRVGLSYAYEDFLADVKANHLNNYTTANLPETCAVSGVALKVFGTKNCQYFYSASVADVAGTPPNGTYPVLGQTYSCYGGWTWLRLRLQGKVYWTALIPDRNTLVSVE